MRIQPRPSLAWAIAIGYAILFLVLEKIMGVGYDTIGTTTDSIVKGIVVPLVVGSIVLIIVTTWLGWWRPVLRELPEDPPGRRAGCWPYPSSSSSPSCSASTTATSATWAAR